MQKGKGTVSTSFASGTEPFLMMPSRVTLLLPRSPAMLSALELLS